MMGVYHNPGTGAATNRNFSTLIDQPQTRIIRTRRLKFTRLLTQYREHERLAEIFPRSEQQIERSPNLRDGDWGC